MRATIAAAAAAGGRGEKRAHEGYPEPGAVPEQDPNELKARATDRRCVSDAAAAEATVCTSSRCCVSWPCPLQEKILRYTTDVRQERTDVRHEARARRAALR